MAQGLKDEPRAAMRILLWLTGIFLLAIVALIVGIEYTVSLEGGGEMVHSFGLAIAVVLMLYYGLVLLAGRSMLRHGNPAWGWHLVAAELVLVFGPIVLVLNLM